MRKKKKITSNINESSRNYAFGVKAPKRLNPDHGA